MAEYIESDNNQQKDSEKFTEILSKIVNEKLTHPFIGTYIISFIILNFNITIKLIFGLIYEYQDYETVINNFTDNFSYFSGTVWKPVIPMITVPLILQNFGDYIYKRASAFTKSKTSNAILLEGNKELITENRILSSELMNIKNENNRLESLLLSLEFFISQKLRVNNGNEKLKLSYSREKFQDGAFVSASLDYSSIIKYNKHKPFHGYIVEKINDDYYLTNMLTKKDFELALVERNLVNILHREVPNFLYLSDDGLSVLSRKEFNESNSFLGKFDESINHSIIFAFKNTELENPQKKIN
ncbi:hypothetical protein [Leptospira mtsangambouensis]|uniref:hypothetical protein n=1 Tax=Leptospira mtsangambouensis TaxID=2484912 RepID=UPI001EEC4576|nr:hypothetical protein [Leptospira mtsangambouensis]MCG6140664.1 hypothetical protein [Leptospira mtsangambouensis]